MAETAWTIGVDLGGTKIAAALVDSNGKVTHEAVVATNSKEGPEAIVKRIAALVNEIRKATKEMPCQAVGVAVAGQVDSENGNVVFAPNLDWHNFALKTQLEKLIDLPIAIVNDVRAATYGEWYFGAGRSLKDFICLFVGTGIGGGIVSGGNLMEGQNNSAGELGHMVVDIGGRKCSCKNRGCLEALASGWAIAEIAQEIVAQKPEDGKALLKAAGGNLKSINAKMVVNLALEKDPLSLQIIDGMTKALIAGVVTLVNAFNPSHIILGGGLINGMPELVERISVEVKRQALKVASHHLSIVQAELKADAGVIGAAKIALQACKQKYSIK